jgi:hypothetical protein
MVSFNQHIILSAEAQTFIGMLIVVLFLLVLAVLFVGVKVHQLIIVVQRQSEKLGVGDCVQARKVERKKE